MFYIIVGILSIAFFGFLLFRDSKKSLEDEFDEIKAICIEENINLQDINFNEDTIKSLLLPISKNNNLAKKIINILDKVDETPYEIIVPTSLDANFMLFFVSKGKQKSFWNENFEYSKSGTNDIIRMSANWSCSSIESNNKDFFKV